MLISSFITGAIFLIFCDLLARVILSPVELPVGIVTGILGGILFIYALNKQKMKL
jgi:iron complex transport system permease protein